CLVAGLRMSHFSEDKNGDQSDPTQRTLLNFLKPGDSNKQIVNEEHTAYEAHGHSYIDPSIDHLSEHDQHICMSSDNIDEAVEHHGLEENECTDQINENTLVKHPVECLDVDAHLQGEEESGHNYISHLPAKHRMRQKEPVVGKIKGKKKQKQSPSNEALRRCE
nr:DNA polymerase kappa isoform X2 [Tanacetum cinerariifolium]